MLPKARAVFANLLLNCFAVVFFWIYVDLKINENIVLSVPKIRSWLSLANLSFVSCPGVEGTADWPEPNCASPGSLKLGWLQSSGQQRKKSSFLRRMLKRGDEGFSDKVGFFGAADVFPKEADFLGSPVLLCRPCTSNLLQVLRWQDGIFGC